MKRLSIFVPLAVFAVAAFAPVSYLAAHCEVPCGIYDDGARFTEMFEDQATIAKAIASIVELADTHDATGHNQLVRWVTTKETHATKTQHIIAQYFMTQKIKTDDPRVAEKLTAAHAVLVAAMKCKQSADPATAESLKAAIHNFQHVYSGAH